ncbi:MAG TPA: hypothetical protein DFR83_16185, partial [Deltaproteobacteria bacterium]|nr:hypothetical protein [Deltaproteobacteria bacterium]
MRPTFPRNAVRCTAPLLWAAWLMACGADNKVGRQSSGASGDTAAGPSLSPSAPSDDTGDLGGTEPVVEPPYCRSLDPDWRAQY